MWIWPGTLLHSWKGIGKFVALNPRYKTLFGPVSISNQYHSISRQLIVFFLERHASLKDWAGLVSTRNPFRPRDKQPRALPSAAFDLDDLSAVVSDLESGDAGVPVLLRQYLKLGGKLLGFNAWNKKQVRDSRRPARRSTGPGSSARPAFLEIRITNYLRHRAEASFRTSAAVARCVQDGTRYARRDLLAVPARSAALCLIRVPRAWSAVPPDAPILPSRKRARVLPEI